MNNISLSAIFEIYGKELPSRSVFFTQKERHGLSYVSLVKAYGKRNIYGAWKAFAQDYAAHVASREEAPAATVQKRTAPKITITPKGAKDE